jgi:hypothetical protein
VKNQFGFSILLFTAFNVDDKSYREVLTPVNNSQLHLKLEILGKFRLVMNHKIQHKGNCNIFWFTPVQEKQEDLETLSVNVTTLIACAHKHFHL